MADLADLHNSTVFTPSPELHEAVVLDDATEWGQEIRCVVPSFGEGYASDPMAWRPYVDAEGVYNPRKGERAVLSYHDGPPVIQFWEPGDREPDIKLASQLELDAETEAREAADAVEQEAREVADAVRVVGPDESVDGAIVAFDGTTGKLVRSAGPITSDQIQSIETIKLTGEIVETQIADDAIATPKLQAGAVTANEMNVGKLSAISADMGTVNAGLLEGVVVKGGTVEGNTFKGNTFEGNTFTGELIEGAEIVGGDITGSTITGVLFRTATEGRRVEIDEEGFRFYDVEDKLKASLDTTTGIATLTAVISSEAGSEINTEHLAGQIAETQIEDDSISTPKLQANSVTASEMSVSTLSAITANLGTITAGTLTGVTFQTSASDPRVYFDDEGFHATDAEGGFVVDIPSDGSTADFNGRIEAEGVILGEGESSTNRLEWVDGEDNRQESIYGQVVSGDTSLLNLRANTSQHRKYGSVRLNARSQGGLEADLYLEAANTVGARVFISGVAEALILDSKSQSDFLQLPEAANATHLWGRVSAAGAKVGGSTGWTVSKVSTGLYKISFSTGLADVATVTWSAAEGNRRAYRIEEATKSYVEIYMSEGANTTLKDSSFHFHVTG